MCIANTPSVTIATTTRTQGKPPYRAFPSSCRATTSRNRYRPSFRNSPWAHSGLAPLLRGPLASLIDATKAPLRLLACTLRDAVCILVAATLSFRALKVAWNNNVDLLPWSSVTFSVALIAAFMAVAYFAFLRRGAGPALAAVACAGVGIAQSFICAFKGVAILPSDLLALGTAAAVSAGYDYVLTPVMLDALGLLCIALAILSLIRPPKLPVGGNMSTEASTVDMPKDLKSGSNAREDSSTTNAARPSLRMTIGSLINRDACPSSNTAMGAHTALGSHPSLESSARSALTLASRRRWNIVAATASVVLAVVCGNSIQGWFNNNQVTDALESSTKPKASTPPRWTSGAARNTWSSPSASHNQYSECDPEWRKGKVATAILGHIEAAHNDV